MFVHHEVALTTWKQREAELARGSHRQRQIDLTAPDENRTVIRQSIAVLLLTALGIIGGSIIA